MKNQIIFVDFIEIEYFCPAQKRCVYGIQKKDGRYALIECKLGSSEIEDGAKHLIQLRNLIRESNKEEKQVPLREPDLLLVLTGGNLAYTREDGVKVIPLACLKW